MYCLDERQPLQGNYDTVKAKTLAIVVHRCNPEERSTCKNETEIDEWLRGKYLVTIENNWKFNSRNYSAEHRVESFSKFRWFPLDPKSKYEQSMMFSVNEM